MPRYGLPVQRGARTGACAQVSRTLAARYHAPPHMQTTRRRRPRREQRDPPTGKRRRRRPRREQRDPPTGKRRRRRPRREQRDPPTGRPTTRKRQQRLKRRVIPEARGDDRPGTDPTGLPPTIGRPLRARPHPHRPHHETFQRGESHPKTPHGPARTERAGAQRPATTTRPHQRRPAPTRSSRVGCVRNASQTAKAVWRRVAASTPPGTPTTPHPQAPRKRRGRDQRPRSALPNDQGRPTTTCGSRECAQIA